eukprot:2709245-Heterocapsa_arctica.AAC.1
MRPDSIAASSFTALALPSSCTGAARGFASGNSPPLSRYAVSGDGSGTLPSRAPWRAHSPRPARPLYTCSSSSWSGQGGRHFPGLATARGLPPALSPASPEP